MKRSPCTKSETKRLEGELLLSAPGGSTRSLGGAKRWLYLGLTLWASMVATGLWLGWMLRGLG